MPRTLLIVYKELDNNPANLVPFIQNEANKEKCYEFGLLNRTVSVAPAIVVSPSKVAGQSAAVATT